MAWDLPAAQFLSKLEAIETSHGRGLCVSQRAARAYRAHASSICTWCGTSRSGT
jgi:hypothetical protein